MMTRCECWQLSFVGLMAYARRHGITTVDELSEATGCCTGCASCRPYLEELLRTGKLRVGDQLIELPQVDEPVTPIPPEIRRRGPLKQPKQQRDDQQHRHRDEEQTPG